MNRFQAGVWGVVLLGALVASGQSATDCCEDQQAKGKKSGSHRHPPACVCPLWVIMPQGPEYLYHAEYFENSCDEEPEVTQMQGVYTLSPGCAQDPNYCEDASLVGKRDKGVKSFPGLPDYIDTDYIHELPADRDGLGKVCSELLFTTYISFQPDPNETEMRYAKVFTYKLDLKRRHNNQNCKQKTIHVALESKAPSAGTPTPFASCERLEEIPITDKAHLYRATLRQTDPPMQIMLLTVKESEK